MTSSRLFAAALLLLDAGFSGSLAAAPTGATGSLTGKLAEGSLYDQLWSSALLYKNEANPYVEEFAVQGQFQTQYATGSSNSGAYGSGDLADSSTWGDVDVRRLRLGVKGRLFQSFKIQNFLDLYPDFSPRVYKGIAETYVAYAPNDSFNLAVGKAELKFTREQELATIEYLTFERSQLVNMFYGGELSGVWMCGKGVAGQWMYHLGTYANDRQDEFTDFSGGAIIMAKAGYNFTQGSGFDLAQVELHYLHNTEPGYAETARHLCSPRFANAVSLSNDLTKGRGGLSSECFWGDGGDGQADVAGVSIMPTWFLADKLQLVTTLQFACSNGQSGITLPTRYEGQVDLPANEKTGDTYFAGYAGLNYYFYGHKLKVMSGVKYSSLTGGEQAFNGWTWLAGLRLGF